MSNNIMAEFGYNEHGMSMWKLNHLYTVGIPARVVDDVLAGKCLLIITTPDVYDYLDEDYELQCARDEHIKFVFRNYGYNMVFRQRGCQHWLAETVEQLCSLAQIRAYNSVEDYVGFVPMRNEIDAIVEAFDDEKYFNSDVDDDGFPF